MRSPTNAGKVEQLMEAIGKSHAGEGRIYFTGGASAVLIGWRGTTIDMDLKLDPEPSGIFEAIPRLKNELDVNIELASPDQFIPELPAWRDRSQFIAKHGKVEFYHYDFYSQALAKIDRSHQRDISDVTSMIDHGLIQTARLADLFAQIEPQLIRFPAIDPDDFRRKVESITHDA